MFTVSRAGFSLRPYRWARCCWPPPAAVTVEGTPAGGAQSEAAVDLTKQGDIEFWRARTSPGTSRS